MSNDFKIYFIFHYSCIALCYLRLDENLPIRDFIRLRYKFDENL
jgi:hypothetical protein